MKLITDYLFSNEHINFLITYSFDFRNEELLSYCMSFLRAISGKLNKNTISLLVKTEKVNSFLCVYCLLVVNILAIPHVVNSFLIFTKTSFNCLFICWYHWLLSLDNSCFSLSFKDCI